MLALLVAEAPRAHAVVVRTDGEGDVARAARKIRRAILIHLYREEKVVEGPVLRPRWRVLRERWGASGA